MSRRPALPIGLRLRWLALLTAGLTACGGGGGDGGGGSTPPPPPPPAGPLVIETVASGLDHPWGVAFLPDGRFLVTERAGGGRTGQMSLIGSNGSRTAVSGLPPARFEGQGGLLDVALDPDHASNRRVYWSYSESGAGGDGLAVARGVLDTASASMGSVQVIYRQLPKASNSIGHYGGRIVFAADQRLFVAMGERQNPSEQGFAQNLGYSHGKVARIERDGSIPADNPFVGTAGARTEIWSRGHRNPQGAAIHPDTGALWITEHGPQGGDELNVVGRGLNYGWPLISHGCDYGASPGNCTPFGGATSGPGLQQPLAIWGPLGVGTTAPGGLAFYTANGLPEWRGKLLVAALAGRTLWRLDIDQPGAIVCTPTGGQSRSNCSEVTAVADLDRRIRDVRQGPDGWVYLLTDDGGGNDAMLRIRR